LTHRSVRATLPKTDNAKKAGTENKFRPAKEVGYPLVE
jgi:hypothetical protein